MTGKRFFINGEIGITDGEAKNAPQIFFAHTNREANKICKILNTLDNKNKELKEENEKLKQENMELNQENAQYDILITNNKLSYIDLQRVNEDLQKQREELFITVRNTKNNLIELEQENEELKKQMIRLYNYFVDWHSDIIGANQFSELWDDVKEDKDWEF